MSSSPKEARPTSTPKAGTVQAPYRPAGYATKRITPTTKTAAQYYNKPSSLTG